MSQQSVLELLEKSKKPMSVQEIRKVLGIRSVDKNIKVLVAHNEIKYVSLILKFKSARGSSMIRPVMHYFV